jgi:hemerythrin-like domain-containing protein
MITLDQLARGGRRNDEGSTLDRPLDHLMACHRRIEDRLETLARAGGHLRDRREEALAAITNSLAFFDVNVARHNADEEESFFPRLRERVPEGELKLLGRLEQDHVVAAGLLRTLKQILDAARTRDVDETTEAAFLAAVAELTELFRDHIAAEDEHLIALASRALPDDALREIATEMKARRGR